MSSVSWTADDWEENGITTHYTRTGGSKPPVVLLHGLTADGGCWNHLASALESEYDVIIPDARGHGRSSAPLSGYRYEDHVADVLSLVRGLELAAPILVGHSLWSMTAALVAGQSATPARALIIIDPTFLDPGPRRERFQRNATEEHRHFLSLDREHALAETRMRYEGCDPGTIERLTDARLKTRVRALEVLTPPYPDYRQSIGAIRVPALWITSLGDASITEDAAQRLMQFNPQLHIEWMSDISAAFPYCQSSYLETIIKFFVCSVIAS